MCRLSKVWKELVEREGCEFIELSRRGKHPKVHFRYRGATQMLVVPSTPSDYRSMRNTVAILRRLCRRRDEAAAMAAAA